MVTSGPVCVSQLRRLNTPHGAAHTLIYTSESVSSVLNPSHSPHHQALYTVLMGNGNSTHYSK